MPVVSSLFTLDAHAQADGRRYCTERHTLDDGSVHELSYLATADASHAAIMAARVAGINESLAESEFAQIVEQG